jgi:dipeptidyl aminopeptidase/acylaminoacyl peptidase
VTVLRNEPPIAGATVIGIAIVYSALFGSCFAALPYSVEDAMDAERAVAVHMTPDGKTVVIQQSKAAAENYNYQAELHRVDLLGQAGAREGPLAGARGEGFAGFRPSPDSRYGAYLHYRAGRVTAGAFDLIRNRAIEFKDVTPDDESPNWQWISDGRLIFSTTSPHASGASFSATAELEWRMVRDGRTSTETVVGSGRYLGKSDAGSDDGIVLANIKTAQSRILGKGRFVDLVASGDGARLAAIRVTPGVPDPTLPIEQYDETGPVLIFETREGGRAAEACSCNALQGSLRWSSSGRQLAFAAFSDKREEPPQVWVYNLARGAARRVELRNLALIRPIDRTYGRPRPGAPPFAWVGEQLAVFARAAAPMVDGSLTNRGNWFLLDSEAKIEPKNLTAEFDENALAVAVTRNALLMSEKGQIWAVPADSGRQLLTSGLARKVRVVGDAFPLDLSSLSEPANVLLLEDEQPTENLPTFYFLDVVSSRILGSLSAPAPDAQIRSVSTASLSVVFGYRQGNEECFSVVDTHGASHEIARLNQFLRNRASGTLQRIDHAVPGNDHHLISWLLLPPGYRGGGRLPTVVDIYPGMEYGLKPPEVDPNDRALLLGAHGYAVLMASIPVDKSAVPREPLQGLADFVLSAVDAGIARGYVDGERLAIQGHSYGGYGTLGVIGQTNRFKAALAISGDSDLVSEYGEPELANRFSGKIDTSHAMGWAETGQGGMGVPPWNDAPRYLRNSPVMHVESITTPVLLMHGDADSNVSVAQSEEMFAALYRLNKDAVFVRYWGEGHHVPTSPANIRDYWNRVYDWYDRYIGPAFDVRGALAVSH